MIDFIIYKWRWPVTVRVVLAIYKRLASSLGLLLRLVLIIWL